MKLDATDFAMGYWFVVSVILTIMQVIHFSKAENRESFIWSYWWCGCIGCMIASVGCVTTVAAFNTENAPYGPICALL